MSEACPQPGLTSHLQSGACTLFCTVIHIHYIVHSVRTKPAMSIVCQLFRRIPVKFSCEWGPLYGGVCHSCKQAIKISFFTRCITFDHGQRFHSPKALQVLGITVSGGGEGGRGDMAEGDASLPLALPPPPPSSLSSLFIHGVF